MKRFLKNNNNKEHNNKSKWIIILKRLDPKLYYKKILVKIFIHNFFMLQHHFAHLSGFTQNIKIYLKFIPVMALISIHFEQSKI